MENSKWFEKGSKFKDEPRLHCALVDDMDGGKELTREKHWISV